MGDVVNRTFENEFDGNDLYDIVDDVVIENEMEQTNFIALSELSNNESIERTVCSICRQTFETFGKY